MTHQLPRLTPGDPEAEAINNVVQAALQLLQKHFASDALSPGSFFKIITELAFLGEVNTLGLLLFAQLQTVTYDLGLAVFTMLSRGKISLLDRTFVAEALGAFEEQLHALAAT